MNKRIVAIFLLVFVSLFSAFVVTVAAADANLICYHITSDAHNETIAGTLIVDLRVINYDTNELLFDRVYRTPAGTHNNVEGSLRIDASLNVAFDNHITYDPASQSPQSWGVNSSANQVDLANCDDGFGKIGDGRINDGADQGGAPLAAYCQSGSIAVWDIDDTGHGTLGFTASKADISKALSDAASSSQDVLIGSGLGNSLYAAAANGQLYLTGPDVKEPGKAYTFIFAPDRCS